MPPYEFNVEFAKEKDRQDPLRQYRDAFYFPKVSGKQALYFCGNSLGLQPKSTRDAVLHELDQWSELAVEGHFEGALPWMHYHKFLQPQTAHIAGAQPEEVVVMNTLTTNLHLLMVSFYRPTRERYKIIMEAGAFPSDQYALETQARHHGLNPHDAIVEVAPRTGEETLRTEDILAAIETHGPQTALVLFGGVHCKSIEEVQAGFLHDVGEGALAFLLYKKSVHAVQSGQELEEVINDGSAGIRKYKIGRRPAFG